VSKDYHPDMPQDSSYLRAIAASTQREHIVMDIQFHLLTVALAQFELPDLYHLVTASSIDAAQVHSALDQWHQKILLGVSDLQKEKLRSLWAYLSADNQPHIQPADLIFVFGGPETVKAKRAVELYKAGLAPKIIFTGDTQRDLVKFTHQSESDRDAEIAIAAGVPEEDLFIERRSINTPENVRFALEILNRREPFPTRFILVNLPWYLLRATNTFLTYWRNAPIAATSIQRVNAGSEQFTAESYFQSRRGLEYIVFEYLKMKQARDMGHM